MRETIYLLLLEKNHSIFKCRLWLTTPNACECCATAFQGLIAAFISSTLCISVVSSHDFTVNLTMFSNSYLNVKDFDIFLKRSIESTPEGWYADKIIKSKLKQIHHFSLLLGPAPGPMHTGTCAQPGLPQPQRPVN